MFVSNFEAAERNNTT